jgi:hypothetical protein
LLQLPKMPPSASPLAIPPFTPQANSYDCAFPLQSLLTLTKKTNVRHSGPFAALLVVIQFSKIA